MDIQTLLVFVIVSIVAFFSPFVRSQKPDGDTTSGEPNLTAR
jgi:hypothetical protein